MAGKNAVVSYWSGSAWVDVVHTGTSNSAVISLDFSDVMGTPTIAALRIQNKSATANGAGAFSSTFTDFMKIRIKDNESQLIYFYGVVYSLTESYDQQWGMVIDLQCRDYLTELKDNSTGGYAGFRIDPAVSLANYVTNFAKSNIDEKTNLYQTTVGGRSAIIKSLINATTDNLTFDPADARFTESVAPFEQEENYELGRKNKKSVLQHVMSLGADDPHDVTANEQFYGYDFYVDPNFTLTTAAHNPKAFFNYFKKGTRPSTDPETYGLQVHLPDKTFVSSGRKFPMQAWEFDRPKGEILTDAVVTYKFLDDNTEDGSTAVGSKITTFEVLQVKTIANLGTSGSHVPRWKGLPIASGSKDFNEDDGVLLPEWLQVEIDSTWTTVARMQYISKLSGITNAAPAYVLISDVDESIAAAYFNENVVWRAKDNTSTTFTIKSRPRNVYGVKRSLVMTVGESVKPSTIRQTIASALLRNSVQVIRGEFSTIKRPEIYFDDSPASLTGTTTQVLNLSGSTNPLLYGFQVGMPVVKLVSGSIPNTGIVYGYASAVTTTEVTVTWNTGSGVSTSDTLRYFVPVRAGDIIHVKNTKVNILDNKFLVTKVVYSEQPGISSTSYTVVGAETNREGGYATKNFQASVSDTLSQAPNLPPTKPNSGNIGESQTSCEFTSTTTSQVDWDAGNLIVGTRTYAIVLGTTASTMISNANGNTGQISTTLNAGQEYYIYYPGTGTALKTVRKNAYRNVVGGEYDPIVIGWCKAASVEAEFSIWVQEFSMGSTKGDAAKKLTKYSFTNVLEKKGMQSWSTDIRFRGTDFNAVKWFQYQDSSGSVIGNETTAGTVSFGDGTTEPITQGSQTGLAVGTHYVYKNVGDSASPTIPTSSNTIGSRNVNDGYADDKILLAIINVTADAGQDSPNIFPFNGNQATISAGVLSAGAIVADNIQAGVITALQLNATALDAHTITLSTGGKFVTASGLSRTGTDNWTSMAGVGTGGGIVIDQYGLLGTSKSDDGDINDTEFYLTAATGKAYFGGGAVVLDSGGMSLTSGGYIRSGTKGYGSNVAGFFLGWSGSAFQFDIGGGTDPDDTYLRWSGTTLVIKGSITLSDGTTEAGMKNSNVDSTQTQLINGVTLTGGGITLGTNSTIKSSGFSYNTSTMIPAASGFQLGSDGSSAYDFVIGNATKYLAWDGSAGTLTIKGNITGASIIELGGSGIDSGADGGGSTATGQIGMKDTDDALAYRIRSHVSYIQMDVLERPMWMLCTGEGGVGGAPSVGFPTQWTNKENFFGPGRGNGATYLGSPAPNPLQGTSSPNSFGVGWKALVLAAVTPTADVEAAHNGTLVLMAHATTGNTVLSNDGTMNGQPTGQYLFTFPQTVPLDGSGDPISGYVLSSDSTGNTSWIAASGTGTVTSITAGTGLSGGTITGSGTIANTGVTSNAAGTGISISGTTGAVTITNTGVTTTAAGTGISVSGSAGAVTIGNIGVTSIVAGDNISISGSTGAVTVTAAADSLGDHTHASDGGGTGGLLNADNAFDAGTISIARGGTNTASYVSNAAIVTQSTTSHFTSVQLNQNGELLIGGTSTGRPSAGTLTGAAGIYVANTDGAIAISTTSTQRLKENIENLTLDTSKIYDLVPRSFRWKDVESYKRNEDGEKIPMTIIGTNSFGLIAEEVKEIMPELVFNNEEGEIQGVYYITFGVLLLEELKKLKARIEVLEGG